MQRKYIMGLITLIAIGVIVVSALSFWVNTYENIETGYQGVVLSWGAPVRMVDAGRVLLNPSKGETLVKVDIQIHDFSVPAVSVASNETQDVAADVTINWQFDKNYADWVYTNLRGDASRVLQNNMEQTLKSTTPKFTAIQFTTARDSIASDWKELLQSKVTQYHIIILGASITNVKFNIQYQEAINARNTADMMKQAATSNLTVIQLQAQQAVLIAQANANASIATQTGYAQSLIISAQGEANATITKAQALSESQRLLGASLTPEYIQWYQAQVFADAWKNGGQVPTYYAGTGGYLPIPIMPVNSTGLP